MVDTGCTQIFIKKPKKISYFTAKCGNEPIVALRNDSGGTMRRGRCAFKHLNHPLLLRHLG